ncbi:hypothetical protein [Agromyces cerinus]|uniref:Tail assembly chaperone n=1 Tax=Agromyces cerinus subsp. cerinus TaxID=232089 RepID=A0A1N6DPX7_9MICO|nr:hypothetical protein [Agromyces cerinus]SIN72858.1 hypothetical protein SAMN05443544_0580 [Agromyces cerinus subsp. cerinus]
MSFLEDLAAAHEKPKPKSEPVSVMLNGTHYELVFERADGDVWAECVSRHPAREESKIDLRYGYNFNEVVLEIAPKTGRLVDGTGIGADAWTVLIPTLSGAEIGRVTDAIWALNEWNPAQEIERAKKASKAGSKRKSS